MLRIGASMHVQLRHNRCPPGEAPSMIIRVEPGETGEFLVVQTKHWPIATREDIEDMRVKLIEMLDECQQRVV